jgi:thiol-disulfide isomerase/thioredoxin
MPSDHSFHRSKFRPRKTLAELHNRRRSLRFEQLELRALLDAGSPIYGPFLDNEPLGRWSFTSEIRTAITSTTDARSALHLNDASGQPVDVPFNSNTLIVGAATWCPHCHDFINWLREPSVQSRLAGLDVVFAYGDESAQGQGAIDDSTWLQSNPGRVAFIDSSSTARLELFPSVYDAPLGDFSKTTDAYDWIDNWLVGRGEQPIGRNATAAIASTTDPRSPLHLNDASGQPVDIPFNANTLIVGTATWCPHCHDFINWLREPDVQSRLAGLDVVFAYGDESAQGNGSTYDSAWLENNPGQVAYLDATGSVKPTSFPGVYSAPVGNSATSNSRAPSRVGVTVTASTRDCPNFWSTTLHKWDCLLPTTGDCPNFWSTTLQKWDCPLRPHRPRDIAGSPIGSTTSYRSAAWATRSWRAASPANLPCCSTIATT